MKTLKIKDSYKGIETVAVLYKIKPNNWQHVFSGMFHCRRNIDRY